MPPAPSLVRDPEPTTGGDLLMRFLVQQGRPQPQNMPGKLLFLSVVLLVAALLVTAGFVFPTEKGPNYLFVFVGCAAGLLFLVTCPVVVGQLLRIAGARRSRRRHPDEPAMADWPWDPSGCGDPRGPAAGRRLALAALAAGPVGAYVAWLLLRENGAHLLLLVVAVALTAGVAWLAVTALARLVLAWRWRGARLRFDRFPYRAGREAVLHWRPPTGLVPGMATFTLRCVVEEFHTTGAGRSAKTEMEHRSRWSTGWRLAEPAALDPGGELELATDLPGGHAHRTSHAGDEIVFWRLEVHVEQPGPDYRSWFKVPVY